LSKVFALLRKQKILFNRRERCAKFYIIFPIDNNGLTPSVGRTANVRLEICQPKFLANSDYLSTRLDRFRSAVARRNTVRRSVVVFDLSPLAVGEFRPLPMQYDGEPDLYR
jgi:hypothetical protein